MGNVQSTENLKSYKMFVGGAWVDTSETSAVVNPATGEKIAEVPIATIEELNLAVKAAKDAFDHGEWRDFQPVERGRLLYKVANLIRQNQKEIAEIEMLDTGKPFNIAMFEVEIGARYYEFYAGVADKIMGETIPIKDGILDFTKREPLGVTAHIIPWNGPFQMTSRSVAPALATGNTVVIKPAQETPLSTLKLAEILDEAGVPKGVVNVVTGSGRVVGNALATHPDIRHITFTGSVETGKTIMKAAAENITPVTLELGGKSPQVVFADADLEEAAKVVASAITLNTGQVCSAGSRLLVERSVHKEFVEKVKTHMETLKIGSSEDNADIGPLITKNQLETVEAYVQYAKDNGAKIHCGGKRPNIDSNGFYYEPTLVDEIAPDSKLAQEEIFGPVLVVLPFDTKEEALEIANGTEFGLSAGIWTSNINTAHWLADRIRSGQVYINSYSVGTGVEIPFGGSKKSGIGREKGLEALKYYTEVKNVAIKYM
ncbi:aldehyde dehydrogenase family protein [Lysinibacillus endophyticus]|uniref:aldehyde dehydrogenase family protein n=1 Tax=Ureibacillus endophyticus TaxID=1978490 RepID=UPI003136819D